MLNDVNVSVCNLKPNFGINEMKLNMYRGNIHTHL